MTNNISHNQLPTMEFDFSKDKIAQIDSYINGLKLKDVQNDENLLSTLDKIKKKFIPIPVEFGEPHITNHQEVQKHFNPSYDNPFGGNRTVFIVTVSFEFSGSTELFKFKPSSYSYGNSYPNIFQPYSNSIEIEVELFQLDKSIILNEARNKIRMTQDFVENNNSFVRNWESGAISYIEQKLQNQKKILENLYS